MTYQLYQAQDDCKWIATREMCFRCMLGLSIQTLFPLVMQFFFESALLNAEPMVSQFHLGGSWIFLSLAIPDILFAGGGGDKESGLLLVN